MSRLLRTLHAGCSLLLLGLGACRANSPALQTPVLDSSRVTPNSPDALLLELAHLRGYTRPHSLLVHTLNPEAFAKAVDEHAGRAEPPEGKTQHELFLEAFGFQMMAPLVRGYWSTALMQEQLAGFYDDVQHQLYLRQTDPAEDPAFRQLRQTLAHELGHALQDQRFFEYQKAKPLGADEQIARQALDEGDAELMAQVYAAQQQHIDPKLGVYLYALSARPPLYYEADELGKAASSEQLSKASSYTRARLIFPYAVGPGFLEPIYRAGGFGLIDKVFAHPPKSSEQVLHPERYLAGDEPIAVALPKAPPGYEVVTSGQMGELQTRIFFANCMPIERAVGAAMGWGGDSYAVISAPYQPNAVLWSTVWDDEDEAKQFERALQEVSRCASPVLARWSRDARRTAIRRQGNRVAFVRGLGEQAFQSLTELLALSTTAPNRRPPLGQISIPPEPDEPPIPIVKEGGAKFGVFENVALGLKVPLPQGFSWKPSSDGEEIAVFSKGDKDWGQKVQIVFAPKGLEDKQVRALFRVGAAQLAEEAGEAEILTQDSAQLSAGSVFRLEMRAGLKRKKHFWMIVIPLCDGAASLAVKAKWAEGEDSAWFEPWLRTIELAPAAKVPLCQFLQQQKSKKLP